MSELGVYITCMDEENLIASCVRSVLPVFPEAKVLDLGSTDKTHSILRDLGVATIFEGTEHTMSGEEYTELKNQIAKKHDWVFFIDGDEIWPKQNLIGLFKTWERRKHDTDGFRVCWKPIANKGGSICYSFLVVNGAKLYKTRAFKFVKNWPRESLRSFDGEYNMQPKDDAFAFEQWCWHLKQLRRSTVIQTSREKRRDCYPSDFKQRHERELVWNELDELPVELKDVPDVAFSLDIDTRVSRSC